VGWTGPAKVQDQFKPLWFLTMEASWGGKALFLSRGTKWNRPLTELAERSPPGYPIAEGGDGASEGSAKPT
jgi:hypothetical protein